MGSCYDPNTGITRSLDAGLRHAHTGSVFYKCIECGKKTSDQNDEGHGNGDQCPECWELAGWDNEHGDGNHAADRDGKNPNCPHCNSEE